jgi:hypothetical protein
VVSGLAAVGDAAAVRGDLLSLCGGWLGLRLLKGKALFRQFSRRDRVSYSPGKASAATRGYRYGCALLLQMTVVQRGERLIDVENFADNLVYAERFQARGVLVEISERGFFIRKKIDPARLLIFSLSVQTFQINPGS